MDDVLVQLQVIFRRLRLVALCCCLVLSVGLWYYCYARPIYKAVSSAECVFFEDKTVDQRVFTRRNGLQELRNELPSRNISELAAKRLGINMGFHGIMQKYINRVRVYQDMGAENYTRSKVQIEVLSYDKEFGEKWAEAIVEEFKTHRELKRDAKFDNTAGNLIPERNEVAATLDNLKKSKLQLEDDLQIAKLNIEHNELRVLPRDITITERLVEEMEKVLSRLNVEGLTLKERFSILSTHDVNNQLGGFVEGLENVKDKLDKREKTVVITPQDVKQDDEWIRLDQEYETAVDEYNKLQLKFGPQHPKLKEVTARVDDLYKKLNAKYDQSLRTFQLSYAQKIEKLNNAKNLMPRYKAVARQLEEAKRQVRDIDRRIIENQRRYDNLVKRINSITTAYDNDNIISIDYIGLKEVSHGSISPNKGKLLIYCAGGALLLGISMAYLIEYMDSSVKAPENVELELQIFGLGIVPELNAKGDVDMLQVHEAFPMFKESFRVIRTNLILRRDEMGRGQVLMLSSSMPQEGKSLCSLELARSFAELGERTLLIDADLRRGKQTRKLTGKKVAGLADFLTGKAQVEPVQFEENLDFLPAGHYSSQAIESLGGQSFSALLMGFRMQYTQIVIDGPPLLGLPDVFMMKESLDGMVVVVSAGHTAFPQLRLAVGQVQKSRIPIHGFILNRVNFSTGGKYYRYYYRNYEYYNQGLEGSTAIIPPTR